MLSPIKQSNRKPANPTTFFHMYIQMDPATKVRVVCFYKDQYSIFKELNNSSSTGCTLKFFSRPYAVILINDKTVVMRKRSNFEKLSDFKTIINEYRLFEKVNIKASVTEVSPVTTTKVCDKCINMQTALAHHKSGTSSIILFDMNYNQIENNKSYVFTKLSLSKDMSSRLLKITKSKRYRR